MPLAARAVDCTQLRTSDSAPHRLGLRKQKRLADLRRNLTEAEAVYQDALNETDAGLVLMQQARATTASFRRPCKQKRNHRNHSAGGQAGGRRAGWGTRVLRRADGRKRVY